MQEQIRRALNGELSMMFLYYALLTRYATTNTSLTILIQDTISGVL